VQEIRGWSAVTRLPNAPAHVLGVLNLRGSIVPVVDLRKRFNLEHAHYTPLTVIIVLALEAPSGRRHFGVVVDAVSDVVDVQSDSVKPTPELGSREAVEHIRGLVANPDRLVVLLDIERLVGAQITDPDAALGPVPGDIPLFSQWSPANG
jgi:purine-binding chemotaxis protein CheW